MTKVNWHVSNSPEFIHEPLKYKRNVGFSGWIEIPEGYNPEVVSKKLRLLLKKLEEDMADDH